MVAIVNRYIDAKGKEHEQDFEVGQEGVTEIIYQEPLGDGDKHYVDVHLEHGITSRQFNLNAVTWKEEDQ